MSGSHGGGGPHLPEGWEMEVTYKPIRNIWFRADPRCRRFRISAPEGLCPGSLEKAIRAKAGWMASRASRPAVPLLIPEHLNSGEACLVRGIHCPVTIFPHSPANKVVFDSESGVEIYVKDGGDPARVMCRWYRECLNRYVPELLGEWEPRLGVRVCQFRIRKMKTRWGSCNTRSKRIWLNLALACLGPDLLEYVVVHELLHLLEPSHNKRFYGLMAGVMPDWQCRRDCLSSHAPGLS